MDFPIKNGGFPSFFVCFPEGNYRFPRPLCAWEIPWVLPAQELVQVMGTQVEKAAGFQRIKYGTPPLSSMICPAHHVEFLDLSMISPWIFSMKPPFFLGKNTIFLWFSDWKPPFSREFPGRFPVPGSPQPPCGTHQAHGTCGEPMTWARKMVTSYDLKWDILYPLVI